MYRILGAVILSCGVLYFTNQKGKCYIDEIKFLKEMSEFSNYCYEQIRFLSTERQLLLSRGILKYKALHFLSGDIKSTDNLFGYREGVVDFIENLGTTDKEGQLSLCERYKEYFLSEYNIKKDFCKKQNKMYKMLGIFSVAATLIVAI